MHDRGRLFPFIIISVAGLAALLASGCSLTRPASPLECAMIGAAGGAAAGIPVGASQSDNPDAEDMGAAVGIGAVGGALLGFTVCALLPEDEPAPPPPAPRAEPVVRKTIVLPGVNFGHDKDELKGAAQQTLDDEVVAIMNKEPDLVVRVEGHTDSQGAEEYNQGLSERRAGAVKAYLLSVGVAEGRVAAIGYGESRPIADNGTPEGRARNRRVELKVLDY